MGNPVTKKPRRVNGRRLGVRHRTVGIGSLLALALAAGTALAAERLDDDAITATLSGVTLEGVYGDGARFSEMYIDNGRVSYFDARGFVTGTWEVKGGTLCTFYEGMEGGCFAVERESENCFVFLAASSGKGKEGGESGEIVARGWDSARPSTCEGVGGSQSQPQPKA
jgi:hypothetical protein